VADDNAIMKNTKQLLREKAPGEKPDKSISRNTARGQCVRVVEHNNVLFGTGRRPTNHEGNIQFHELVSKRKGEYMATKNPQVKANIAKAIVETVFDKSGPFSKKYTWRSVNFRDSLKAWTSMLWQMTMPS
jgi:phenylalanyl-tRNA synthetase beta subunit